AMAYQKKVNQKAEACAALKDPCMNAFVTKLAPPGSGLLYSTYLGGALSDAGEGIALGDGGTAYVTGTTSSPDFPHTASAYQPTLKAGLGPLSQEAFVTGL